MNKKEISEIRKQFTPENCSITRICGCLVNSDKEIQMTTKEAFLSLPEEEMFKYFEILRKSLSGTLGKNLVNMEFPFEEEQFDGAQPFLLKLRDSKLSDDEMMQNLYDIIVNYYDYSDNYYIVTIHAVYDIPGKTRDGKEIFDASDEIYDFIMCCICPVKLSKAGLSYKVDKRCVESRERDWVVDMPMNGFLFPAFNDRSTDIHSTLYYAKNPNNTQFEFLKEVLGIESFTPHTEQKSIFDSAILGTFNDAITMQDICNIQYAIRNELYDHIGEPEPVLVGKEEIENILSEAGYDETTINIFSESWESENAGSTQFPLSNLSCGKSLKIITNSADIKVNECFIDKVQVKVIDGERCVVIPADGFISVDGITVKE